jgi:hypothetical protein
VHGEEGEQITYRLRLANELTTGGELEPSKTRIFTTSTATLPFTETGLGSGKWYWQIQAVGADGGVSEWSDIWHVTVDAVLPAITILKPDGVYGGPQTNAIPLSAEVIDEGGIKSCVVAQDDGTPIPLGDNNNPTVAATEPVTHLTLSGTIDAASLTEGTHGVTVTVEDIAGNISQKSVQYFVDKSAPQLTPSISDNQKLKGMVDITLQAEDTTLQTSSISILDSANSPLALEEPNAELDIMSAETRTLTWDTKTASNGMYTIVFFAKDAAGNETTLTRTVTVDNSTLLPGSGAVTPVSSTSVVDPLLDQLSKQLTQPFPAPQGFDITPAAFTNMTEGVGEEVASARAITTPETDRGIKPVAVTPTESGWKILGVLWYWWALIVGTLGVVIFKWRSILMATTLVLRK